MTKTYKIGAGYNGEVAIFHLRSISVAEDNRYAARFLEIPLKESEERKAELEYNIYVDAIASWSEKAPTTPTTDDKGNAVEAPIYGDLIPADAVRKFFEERNPETERIAPAIIGNYRKKLQPEIVFY